MTDTPDTEDIFSVELSATLRSGDGGQITLRQIALGMDPLILIEIDTAGGDDNTMPVTLDATGFDPDQLVDFLEMMVQVAKRARDTGDFTPLSN